MREHARYTSIVRLAPIFVYDCNYQPAVGKVKNNVALIRAQSTHTHTAEPDADSATLVGLRPLNLLAVG